jgi:hypothetical protein
MAILTPDRLLPLSALWIFVVSALRFVSLNADDPTIALAPAAEDDADALEEAEDGGDELEQAVRAHSALAPIASAATTFLDKYILLDAGR